TAFAGMIVVTAAMIVVAVGRDSQRVALVALAGGFLTPLLVSTGKDEQLVLWMDILLVNGSTLEDLRAAKCHYSRLYHNNRDGTFTDISSKANLTHCGWGFGVAVGDYDNDGWDDLYITYLDGGI